MPGGDHHEINVAIAQYLLVVRCRAGKSGPFGQSAGGQPSRGDDVLQLGIQWLQGWQNRRTGEIAGTDDADDTFPLTKRSLIQGHDRTSFHL